MGLFMAAALKLGETLVKAVFKTITGQDVVGDAAGGLATVLGDKALSWSDVRRARRLVDGIADATAKHVAGAYEHEFRGLSETDRAVAVDAVRETFAQIPATEFVLAVDFDAGKLERHIRQLTRDYLTSRYFGQDEVGLYDVLLQRSCVAVVGIVRDLSDLANRAVPEILDRLTILGKDVWEAPRQAITDAAKDKDSAFTEVYREYVDDSMDMVKLDSTRLTRVNCYPLSVAYLSLPARLADGQVTTVEEAFAGRKKVLIRAYCGCGKTTYLHRLFMLTARRGLSGRLAPLNHATPFYLSLHRYADGSMPTVDDLFADAGADIRGEMPPGWVQRQLREGDSLVLINGVDELPAGQRSPILAWIKKVTTKFDRARYVLTSRPGAVSDDWAVEAGFQIIDLLPMGPADAVTFIRRWHEAIKIILPGDEQRIDRCAARLVDALACRHALRALSMNPLTCALMCALHYEEQVALPDQWLDLVRLVIEILVSERDQARGVADDLPAMSREQRIFALQDIAYWMTTEEMTDANVTEVRQRVEHMLMGMGLDATNGHVDNVLDYLIARSGLIHVRPGGRLRFSSPVVRDYLAAKEAVSGSHIRFLLRQSRRIERQHLVVMAAGSASLAGAEELLSGLLSRVDEEETTRERLRVLVHECLRVVPAVGAELRQRAEACCCRPVPRTQQEAEVLAATGPLAIDVLAAQPTDDVDVALALIHAAKRIGGNDVVPLLARFAGDIRPAVQQALQDGAQLFDHAQYDRMVLAVRAGEGDPCA